VTDNPLPFCVAPPTPELQAKILASRRRLTAREALPEHATVDLLDMRTLTLIIGRSPSTRSDTFTRSGPAPAVTGTRRALVIIVDFPDEVATQTQAHYTDMLFSSGSYPTGSMRDFYTEASYGALTVDGVVSGNGGPTPGWYRAPQPKSFYTNAGFGFGGYPHNSQKLVEDLVALAAPHVNFSDYDNDGDGIVDALVILAAGTGGEVTGDSDDIWSHAWAVPTPVAVDGVAVSGYFIAPEDGKVGVMSHELGHSLMHWPDLYDTDYSSSGTGSWDLMAGGSWNGGGDRPAHPSAWCKLKAGWVTPVVVDGSSVDATIRPYATDPQVYQLPVGAAGGNEYFLASNRQQIGFDDNLPGSGLIIEHIDDSRSNNTDETHYLVDIEQCDGRRDLNRNANRGDADDAWPGGGSSTFDGASTPSSTAYDGSDPQISVSAITSSGTDITAHLSVREGAPADMSSIVGTWNVMVDWGNDGAPVPAGPFTFNANGTWSYPFGGGRWIQVDGVAAWTFTNAAGLVYTGTITHNAVLGIMGYTSAPPNPGTGSFYLVSRAASPSAEDDGRLSGLSEDNDPAIFNTKGAAGEHAGVRVEARTTASLQS
jgi:immune inhibitor A